MKSTLYSESIKQFDYSKPQLVESLKETLVLLTIENPNGDDEWERENKKFSGVVVNSGSTNLKIGTIVTQQSISFYTLYKGHIKLEN